MCCWGVGSWGTQSHQITQTSAVFLLLPTITIGTTSCCCHGNHKYHPLCKQGCRGHSGRLAARLRAARPCGPVTRARKREKHSEATFFVRLVGLKVLSLLKKLIDPQIKFFLEQDGSAGHGSLQGKTQQKRTRQTPLQGVARRGQAGPPGAQLGFPQSTPASDPVPQVRPTSCTRARLRRPGRGQSSLGGAVRSNAPTRGSWGLLCQSVQWEPRQGR